jgi:two-component sensor histidine kinase
LATNSAKYGALSVPQGSIKVEWSHVGDSRVLIRWNETGGPPVKKPARQGFGTHVMKRIIDQLGGQIHFDWRPEGLICEITLPK